MNPFNITGELRHLERLLEEQAINNNGEVDDQLLAQQEELLARIDFEGAANLIREIKATIAMYQAQLDAFRAAKGSEERKLARLQEMILVAMEAKGEKKRGSFTVAKNGGLRPVKITGKVTPEFTKFVPSTDMAKIREALERGQELEFATMGERGKNLRTKATVE